MHGRGEFAHDLRGSRNFTNGFFFYAQTHQQGRSDGGRHFATHQHAHEVQHFVMKDFTMFDAAVQCFAWCDHGAQSYLVEAIVVTGSSRKLRNKA